MDHGSANPTSWAPIAVDHDGTVADAIEALRQFEGGGEALATIYLTGAGNILSGEGVS